MQQKTIKDSISCNGVGVHSGENVTITLHPGEVDSGITFIRSDIDATKQSIKAVYDNVTNTTLCTTISNNFGTSISTIEHLMAAFAALEISNIKVEINAPEVPIMDGSAAPFIHLLNSVGVCTQNSISRFIKVKKKIKVSHNDNWAVLEPSDNFKISCKFDFKDRNDFGVQEYNCDNVIECFQDEVAKSRTFGFYEDIEKLQANGFARGGSLDNAVVIKGNQVLNPEGFRVQDECVKHKVLDVVGDLYLAGAPIIGHFHGYNTGHTLNNMLLKELFADDSAWDLMDDYNNLYAIIKKVKPLS